MPLQPCSIPRGGSAFVEVNEDKTPTGTSPSSWTHGDTMDAGMLAGWRVWDPGGLITGIVDDGVAFGVTVNPGNLSNDCWGNADGPQANNGVAFYYPNPMVAALDATLDALLNITSQQSCFGLIQFTPPATVALDSLYSYNGFGPLNSATVSRFKASVWGPNGGDDRTEFPTLYPDNTRHLVHTVWETPGNARFYFTPSGGSETEHGAPSDNNQQLPSAPLAGIGLFAFSVAETFKLYRTTLTGYAAP
jgi:hypothetical protein